MKVRASVKKRTPDSKIVRRKDVFTSSTRKILNTSSVKANELSGEADSSIIGSY